VTQVGCQRGDPGIDTGAVGVQQGVHCERVPQIVLVPTSAQPRLCRGRRYADVVAAPLAGRRPQARVRIRNAVSTLFARGYTAKPLNRVSIKNRLINLHCFFDRITEWGHPNPPQRPLIFTGDLPIVDKPLPRVLDDAAATKLMRTSRADPDPLSRLIVELLARTGIRKGELLALTVDADVQIGSAVWMRIPVGKLHNDRYIPLHPQLKEMLDDWIANHRAGGLRSQRLLIERNRPISALRVATALSRLSHEAGIGHVTAHQLRHTLATRRSTAA